MSDIVIYKIICKDINIKDFYIGHTTNFSKRKIQHKSSYNKGNNMLVYQFIRNNGGWENWDIILIESCKCEKFSDACKIEKKYIEDLKATLNKAKPIRTKKEYYEDNKEKINETKKLYNQKNKEKISETVKKYYEDNKEKILNYIKEYNEDNKEKIKEYRKEYNKKKY